MDNEEKGSKKKEFICSRPYLLIKIHTCAVNTSLICSKPRVTYTLKSLQCVLTLAIHTDIWELYTLIKLLCK